VDAVFDNGQLFGIDEFLVRICRAVDALKAQASRRAMNSARLNTDGLHGK
jgi:hypothetical protein